MNPDQNKNIKEAKHIVQLQCVIDKLVFKRNIFIFIICICLNRHFFPIRLYQRIRTIVHSIGVCGLDTVSQKTSTVLQYAPN